MKRIRLTESDIRRIVTKVIKEDEMAQPGTQNKGKKDVPKPRCVRENMIPLDEIVGQADEYSKYSPGIKKRRSGVNSMVDTLGILNNIRWANDVKDGGSHLAYEMMNHLNRFRNKNYWKKVDINEWIFNGWSKKISIKNENQKLSKKLTFNHNSAISFKQYITVGKGWPL